MEYQPLQYQIRAVSELFDLDPESAYGLSRHLAASRYGLPAHAKSFFAVPAWPSLANSYSGAVERMLKAFAKHIPFDNKFAEPFTDQVIRQSERSREAWAELQETHKSDIIILPAQLGSLHQNQCLNKARESFRPEEFELGALAVGCILLMHPTWKVRERRSYIDTGDEYFPGGDEEKVRLLNFARSTNGFIFDHRPHDLASPFAGVATGFLR